MSEIKSKSTFAGTALSMKEYCSECRNRFTEDNKPLSLGCFCKELLCRRCVTKIVQTFQGAQCPRCTQVIEKEGIKVDEGVLEIILLLRAREAQTAERYQNQIDVLKDVIKTLRQKQKQQQSVFENLKYQIRQNDTEKQIIKEKYEKMLEEQKRGFEDKLKQSRIELAKAVLELDTAKKEREASEQKYKNLQAQYEATASRMEQMNKALQAHQSHKARMAKQMSQLRKNCKQFQGHINQKINEARSALIQFANLQFNDEITINLQPLDQLQQEENAKIEGEGHISRLDDSMLQVQKQFKTKEKNKEISALKECSRQAPASGTKNKSEVTLSKETKSDKTQDLTYDRYFEQEYFETGEEEESYPEEQPQRNLAHSQLLHPSQMHYQVEHSPWSEIFARHGKQREQQKIQSVEGGYREARQTGLQQEVIRINMKINQFMKNENVRKKVQEDHVVKFLKQLDKQSYIKPEEYYLITDVENKKSDAQKKLELIISLRKGEYPKYKNLELQLFSYTIETIKSVRLDNFRLQKLINLSAVSNLKALDVSNNVLRSIKPVADNTLLQILYINNNCLQNLDGLAKLANLRKLSIHENRLSQQAYLYLSKCQLSKLKQIWLGSSYCIQSKGENDQCLRILLSRCYPALIEVHLNLQLFHEWREIIRLYNCQYHAYLGVISLE